MLNFFYGWQAIAISKMEADAGEFAGYCKGRGLEGRIKRDRHAEKLSYSYNSQSFATQTLFGD